MCLDSTAVVDEVVIEEGTEVDIGEVSEGTARTEGHAAGKLDCNDYPQITTYTSTCRGRGRGF